MYTIPLIKLYDFRKIKIHNTHHRTPNAIYVGALCHTRAENLLKGPVIANCRGEFQRSTESINHSSAYININCKHDKTGV